MIFVKSVNLSLKITQIIFHVFGLWRPNHLTGFLKQLYNFYSVISLMSVIGTYIIVQVGDLVQVWGNLPYMTGTIFLLFTNLALGTKALNVMWKKKIIQDLLSESYLELAGEKRIVGRNIVKSCDDETSRQLAVYFSLSMTTVLGWAASAEKNQLPLRAWYPYDASKTPAYQLTYAHQSIAILLAAVINICLDTLVTSLVSMCRCRLRLLGLSLATLCDGLDITDAVKTLEYLVPLRFQSIAVLLAAVINIFLDTLVTSLVLMCRCRLRLLGLSLATLSDGLDISDAGSLTAAGDKAARDRLGRCVVRHQAVLNHAARLQSCFSMPLLAQFSVSMVIICVTAYQLAFESTSLVRVISMVAYLTVMMLQVFIYCYQGNQLYDESEAVSTAAYMCPWYACSAPVRRSLLLLTTRTRLATKLTAGGFTQLSLATFMAIIKASYSFFTVLKQVEEK